MKHAKKFAHTCKLLGASTLLCLASNSMAKQVEVHDPVMTKEGDTYYVFSTGMGITY